MHTSEQSTSHEQNPLFQEAAEALHSYEQVLAPGTDYILDPYNAMAYDSKFGCSITAVITADKHGVSAASGENPSDSFVLVDIRKNAVTVKGEQMKVFGGILIDPSVDFLLIGANMDDKVTTGFKGIRKGETVNIGRSNPTTNKRFGLTGNTSRDHFDITYLEDGRLSIRDNNSSNGTAVESTTPLREKVQQRGQSKEKQSEAFKPPAPEAPQQAKETFGLSPELQKELFHLSGIFGQELGKGEISDAMIAGIIREVDDKRREGIPDDKIYKQIARKIHPDKFEAGSFEHARMTAMIKVTNLLLRK